MGDKNDKQSKVNNSVTLSEFLNWLREVKSDYSYAQDTLKWCDDATQDILHKLELEPVKYKERARLATKLQNIRRERRAAKDLISVTEDIVEWINTNSSVIKSLERLLGGVRKAENKLGNRMYFNRTAVIDTEENNIQYKNM